MTSDEIREVVSNMGLLRTAKNKTTITGGFEIAVALFEIAIQLAELNVSIRLKAAQQ